MANNPYVNKVVFGSATLVDLTGTTATADKIMQGYGAYGADGAWMDGTASGGGGRYQAKTVTPSNVQQIVLPDKIVYDIDVPVNTLNTSTSGTNVSWMYDTANLTSGATYEVEGEFTFNDGTIVTISGPCTYSYYIDPIVTSTGPSTISAVLLLSSVIYIEFNGNAPSGGIVSKALRVYAPNQQVYDALSQVTVEAILNAGLDYETGTYTPTADTSRPTISFSKTHSTTPFLVAMSDTSSVSSIASSSNTVFCFFDPYRLNGVGYPYSTSAEYYAVAYYTYRSSSSSTTGSVQCSYNSDNTGTSSNSYPRYWVTPSNFKPYSNSSSRYWRKDRTYKWIAVWKP